MQANLFGIEFSAIDTLEAKTRIILALKQKMQSLYFINAHCANVAQENAEYRDALHQTNLLLPDGVGIELGCKFTYQSVQQNLNGTDLFPHICQICEITSSRIFLLGGEPGTAEQVQLWMKAHYPDINVVGTHHGHFNSSNSAENDKVIAKINSNKSDVVFVAMGVPRQELWIQNNKHKLDTSLNVAVGGLFEFYSGNIPRASDTIRSLKLEWIWRLMQEPKRLWKRYILGTLSYLMKVAGAWRQWQQKQRLLLSRFNWLNRHLLLSKQAFKKRKYRFNCWRSVAAKRGFDILGSGVALLFLSPFFPLIAAAIKLDSKGPLFFTQTRIGENGVPFNMIKFRSMCVNAEEKKAELAAKNEKKGGVMFKIANDPRVTSVGRFIRKHSIDELPQLWNIFRGDMTIVGPRPGLPNEVNQYLIYQRTRVVPKPGITSQWVISGRNDLTFAQQAELDVKYHFKRTLWSDIKIILKTIPVIFTGRGAS